MLEIRLDKKVSLRGYTLVEGFPGIGWIATIAAGHLVEKLNMKDIGYVESDQFAPVSVILKGKPMFPVRMYADPKTKISVLLSEFVVPSQTIYPLSRNLVDLAKKQGVKRVISLAGITSLAPQKKTAYGIASNDKVLQLFKKEGITPIEEGVTAGVSGVLLSLCAREDVNAMGLLVPTMQKIPDPGAAADLLEIFSRVTRVKVDTTDLKKEASQIQEKVKTMLAKIEKGKKGYDNAEKNLYPGIYG